MRFVVTLTTWRLRLSFVHVALKSLIAQQPAPDQIILWLSEEEIPQTELLPADLKALVDSGQITLRWFHENIKSHKKLIPSLLDPALSGCCLITADDDIIYEQGWFAGLRDQHFLTPHAIIAHRARIIKFDPKSSKLLPYNKWPLARQHISSSHSTPLFPTTGGGVLYPPNSLHPNVKDFRMAIEHANTADDVFLWIHGVLNRTPVILTQKPRHDVIQVPQIKDPGLARVNCLYGGNDLIIKRMLALYAHDETIVRLLDRRAFDSRSYWEHRYRSNGTSGAGSYNHLARFKADIINFLLRELQVTSLIDLGMGDGNQLALLDLNHDITYLGVDVSLKAVEMCRFKFPHLSFILDTDLPFEPRRVDMTMSCDVIYHLVEDSVYHKYMADLFHMAAKYVLIYAYDEDKCHATHVRYRKFTHYINTTFQDWKLVAHIPQKYLQSVVGDKNDTLSDFYLFQRNDISNTTLKDRVVITASFGPSSRPCTNLTTSVMKQYASRLGADFYHLNDHTLQYIKRDYKHNVQLGMNGDKFACIHYMLSRYKSVLWLDNTCFINLRTCEDLFSLYNPDICDLAAYTEGVYHPEFNSHKADKDFLQKKRNIDLDLSRYINSAVVMYHSSFLSVFNIESLTENIDLFAFQNGYQTFLNYITQTRTARLACLHPKFNEMMVDCRYDESGRRKRAAQISNTYLNSCDVAIFNITGFYRHGDEIVTRLATHEAQRSQRSDFFMHMAEISSMFGKSKISSELTCEFKRLVECQKTKLKGHASAQSLATLFMQIQRTLEPDVSYEIGAFEASFSLQIKKQIPQIRAIAFEANPFNFKHWSENSNFSSIEYIFMAITDHEGVTQFSLQDFVKANGKTIEKVRGNNSLMQRADNSINYQSVNVPCDTLDSFASKNGLSGKRACAWIDVEGAQRLVLPGAKNTLFRDVLTILIEVEHVYFWNDQWLSEDVQAYLDALGFVCVARDFQNPNQNNLLFVKHNVLSHVVDEIRRWHKNT